MRKVQSIFRGESKMGKLIAEIKHYEIMDREPEDQDVDWDISYAVRYDAQDDEGEMPDNPKAFGTPERAKDHIQAKCAELGVDPGYFMVVEVTTTYRTVG